jgi:heptosyltransferase-2/heptosyltransferase-3
MPHALIVLRGAQEEVPMLREIQQAAALETVVVAELPLRPMFALCEAAHSMISVDTGPAHAAAALGTPLVVMFGAGPQRQWLPRSALGSPIIGVGGPPISNRVDQISVDAVFDAWCALLAKMHAPARQIAAAASSFHSDVAAEMGPLSAGRA